MSPPESDADAPGGAAHVIRLRGPWQAVAASGPPLRAKLPCGWRDAFGEGVDQVRLSRRFNQPTSLGPGTRVLVRLSTAHTLVGAQLNGGPLLLDGSAAELPPLQEGGNELTVTLLRGQAEDPVLEAQLEIISG